MSMLYCSRCLVPIPTQSGETSVMCATCGAVYPLPREVPSTVPECATSVEVEEYPKSRVWMVVNTLLLFVLVPALLANLFTLLVSVLVYYWAVVPTGMFVLLTARNTRDTVAWCRASRSDRLDPDGELHAHRASSGYRWIMGGAAALLCAVPLIRFRLHERNVPPDVKYSMPHALENDAATELFVAGCVCWVCTILIFYLLPRPRYRKPSRAPKA